MIEVIPFTREEKWFFARVCQGMHEMDKSEDVCFRARQNPCAGRSKDFFELRKKAKTRTITQKEGSEICIWKSRPVVEAFCSFNPSDS
jgi:hypothetical protein